MIATLRFLETPLEKNPMTLRQIDLEMKEEKCTFISRSSVADFMGEDYDKKPDET